MKSLSGNALRSRCASYLPKGIPSSAIEGCIYDEDNGADGHRGQYWVDLADGYMCAASEASAATGYTLQELREELRTVYKE